MQFYCISALLSDFLFNFFFVIWKQKMAGFCRCRSSQNSFHIFPLAILWECVFLLSIEFASGRKFNWSIFKPSANVNLRGMERSQKQNVSGMNHSRICLHNCIIFYEFLQITTREKNYTKHEPSFPPLRLFTLSTSIFLLLHLSNFIQYSNNFPSKEFHW